MNVEHDYAGKPTVFYDGECPLCSKEIAHYRRVDKANKLNWVDLTKNDVLLAEAGINYHAAMRRLHCIDAYGEKKIGVDAFLVVWEHMPKYRHLANVIKALYLRRPLNFLYNRFANYRYKQRCEGACYLK